MKHVNFSGSTFQSKVELDFLEITTFISLKNTNFQENTSFHNSSIKKIILGNNFPFKGTLNLRGLAFKIFEGGKKHWKKFVKAQASDNFSRDPFIQIEKYFHQIGDEVEAANVYFEGRNELRKYALKKDIKDIRWSCRRKLWDLILKHLTGYGVKTERLFIPITLFLALGTYVFWDDTVLIKINNNKHESLNIVLKKSEQTDNELARKIFQNFGYSVDIFIPVLDLQIAKKFELSKSAPLWKEYYKVVHILAGWFFIPLLIASISGIIRRDNN